MFDQIPRSRLMIYAMVLGLIPIAFALFQLQQNTQAVDQLSAKAQSVKELALIKEGKLSFNKQVKAYYENADHFYIGKYLENLLFLEPEVEALQKVLNHEAVGDNPVYKKRLEFLTGPDNALSFTEGTVHSYADFQETTETLVHPIEINVDDLKTILSRIEGVQIGDHDPQPHRPQLLITDFKLDKKRNTGGNEVFILQLKLLKREFL